MAYCKDDPLEMLKAEAAERAGGMTREEYADQLLAARAMLAALQAQKQFWLEASQRGTLEVMADTIHPDETADMRATLDAAIAQAEAAGIKVQS